MYVRIHRVVLGLLPLMVLAFGGPSGATGCTCVHRVTADRGPSVGRNDGMTREQAIDRATAELRAQGRDPAVYDMTVLDDGTEWEIVFDRKPPRPLGGDLSIFVSKRDGSVRTMLGE